MTTTWSVQPSEGLKKANKKFNEVKKEHQASDKRLSKAALALTEERKRLVLRCSECKADAVVNDLEAVEVSYGGWFDSSDECWVYQKNCYLVCPSCTQAASVDLDTPCDFFPSGIRHSLKAVRCWNSKQEKLHGRAKELLEPHLKREEEERSKLERQRKLEEARRLLKEAGEL